METTRMRMSDVTLPNDSSSPLEDWELLTEIVVALVKHPDSVRVEEETEADATRYVIYVDPEDIGKVIGKSGETVSLLRKLFGRIAASRHQKVAIDVFDPSKSTPGSKRDLIYRGRAA